MPAFIVTLAGMFLARGVAFVLSIDSVPITHPFYRTLQNAYWLMPGRGRLTLIGVLMLLVFALGMLIAHRTRFGTNVYALGGGEQTARLMGVPIWAHDGADLCLVGLAGRAVGDRLFALHRPGYSLAAVGVELTRSPPW